ncbi:hypothetical protein [Methylomonas koyamae]|uniref:hypothetical protein n=1 Tax=Methylomonas koyamae TaxID=702114 RepID=UPI000B239D6A|nr:hypothetical protein [Methylomonas koyamae]
MPALSGILSINGAAYRSHLPNCSNKETYMAMNLLLFCKEDIWRLDERSLAWWPALCVRCLKIALLAVQAFAAIYANCEPRR